jgi:hypothetical protein
MQHEREGSGVGHDRKGNGTGRRKREEAGSLLPFSLEMRIAYLKFGLFSVSTSGSGMQVRSL